MTECKREDIETYLPKNLRFIRESLDFTQKEMAEKLEIGESLYKKYELGKIEPKVREIIFFGCKLKCSIANLIEINMEETFDSVQILKLHVNRR